MKNKKILRDSVVLICFLLGLVMSGLQKQNIQMEVTATAVPQDEAGIDGATGYIQDDIILPALEEDVYADVDADTDVNTDTDVNSDTDVDENAGIDTQSVKAYAMSGSAANTKAASSTIPVSFDARTQGLVTSVKDQGVDNTCWAYSAASVAESSMISQKMADNTIDLSEEHLAYYFYNTNSDPLGNTTGDTTLPVGGDYLSVGGNYIFTTFALANWIGIADESVEDELDWNTDVPGTYSTTDRVHLQNAYWINLKLNPSHVKRLIQANGAVGTSMYYRGTFYNGTTYSYYNNLYSNVNHAVTLVGWDDNYSKTNFRTQPADDGAWLVKNSYGEDWGNGGYFWVSYEDAALTSATAKAYAFIFESADNYDYNYKYDGTAGVDIHTDTGYRVASGGAIANVYTIPTDAKTRYQTLEAVSFALYMPEVDYSIQIYHNLLDPSDPTSGTAILDTPVTGRTSYVGYYTVPLETDVVFDAGDTFSVVITLNQSAGKTISYFVDKSYQNGSWIEFHNETAQNQSFAYSEGSWTDLASTGVSARIKAFADDYEVPVTQITMSQNKAQLWKGQTLDLTAEILPQNSSYPQAVWTSSDEKVATVSQEGVVTGLKAGSAIITATAQGDAGLTTSCTITVKQQATSVKLTQTQYYMKAGEELAIELALSPKSADLSSLGWESSDETVASVDGKGVMHSISNGTTNISVYSIVSGERFASLTLTVHGTGKAPTEEQTGDAPKISDGDDEVTQPGAVAKDETVAGLPLTGDDSAVVMWGILMIAAAVVGCKTYKRMKSL